MIDPLLDERVLRVARALREAGVPHAFGGAIAYNYYGEPRLTHDLDVNIFLPASGAGEILSVLGAVGVPCPADGVQRIERDEQIRIHWDQVPLDLFFASVPFLAEAGRRTRMVPFPPDELSILSAEDLTVCKVLFNREKDWKDIRNIVMIQADALDTDYIGRWLVEMLGDVDERLARFRALIVASD